MNSKSHVFSLILILLIGIHNLNAQTLVDQDDSFASSHPQEFSKYWFSGNAELCHYDLSQTRYGEKREGDVIMVFVSEDFLLNEQVKKEFGDGEAIKILKSNIIKKFPTGIYDYSIMSSIYTPFDYRNYPTTLKITSGIQDWCGQTFVQLNIRDRRIDFEFKSYFQKEADREESIDATYLEDDLWNRMRLEPQTLPLGKISMVPSLEFLQLNHVELQAYSCEASLFLQVNDSKSGEEFYLYKLFFPELDRIVEVKCQAVFPFRILGWKEIISSQSGRSIVNEGKLTEVEIQPYWELTKKENGALRDSLGLRYQFR